VRAKKGSGRWDREAVRGHIVGSHVESNDVIVAERPRTIFSPIFLYHLDIDPRHRDPAVLHIIQGGSKSKLVQTY